MSDTDLEASVLDLDGIGRYLAGDFAGRGPVHAPRGRDLASQPPLHPSVVGRTAVLAR